MFKEFKWLYTKKHLNQISILDINKVVAKGTFSVRPNLPQITYKAILDVNKNLWASSEIPTKHCTKNEVFH